MSRFVAILAAALGIAAAHGASAAETYPSRPVHVIVPFEAGAPDTVARVLGQQLSQQLGQPVVVDNRPGANGVIGSELVSKTPPDGYLLLITSTSFAVNPSIYKKLPYDWQTDFVPVTNICSTPGLILGVNPAVPATSAKALIALARKSDLAYGSPGVGNTLHLAAALFAVRAKIKLTHVPYKGAGPAIAALLGNEVQLMFMTPPLSLPHIKAGKIRALAFTGAARAPFLPDVPTMAEAGVAGMTMDGGWFAMFAPARTPAAVVDRLQSEVKKALATPLLQERLAQLGLDPVGDTPAAFKTFLAKQVKDYAEMVRLAGIRPE
jgi:tripartite-type tricarboxylate transporter receptor subunit TctC